jgi:hypothetical protein
MGILTEVLQMTFQEHEKLAKKSLLTIHYHAEKNPPLGYTTSEAIRVYTI